MKLTVQPVGVQYVHKIWPLVEELFEKANKYDTGDYTLDQIKGLLAAGSWVLLVATDEENTIHGAASVSFYNMPNYRVGFITAMAGGRGCVHGGIRRPERRGDRELSAHEEPGTLHADGGPWNSTTTGRHRWTRDG